ncbi:MAG: hypothetical protein MK193_11385 [Lentisphaeria bacterium]|nr:hypothetical protein [Lentisphaeria bacterium]
MKINAFLATLIFMTGFFMSCGKTEKEIVRGEIQIKTEKKDEVVIREYEYYTNEFGRVVIHGTDKHYFADGKTIKIETNFKDGKMDGVGKEFYSDGKKKNEAAFKDGFPDGMLTTWHPNGQIEWKGQNVNGLQDGTWTHYDDKGNVIETQIWEKGELQK